MQKCSSLLMMFVLLVFFSTSDIYARSDNPFVKGQVWNGWYDCGEGKTKLKFTILNASNSARSKQSIAAIYDFTTLKGVNGSFNTKGLYRSRNKAAIFKPTSWIKKPAGYGSPEFQGTVSADGSEFIGKILWRGCSDFKLYSPASTYVLKPGKPEKSSKQQPAKALAAKTDSLNKAKRKQQALSKQYEKGLNALNSGAVERAKAIFNKILRYSPGPTMSRDVKNQLALIEKNRLFLSTRNKKISKLQPPSDDKSARQRWVDAWVDMISRVEGKKWDSFVKFHIKTKLCSNYYYRVDNAEQMRSMHKQAGYIVEAGVEVGGVKTSSRKKLLAEVTNVDKELMNSWRSENSAFLLKAKSVCTDFSRKVAKMGANIPDDHRIPVKQKSATKPKPSKHLNYPNVVIKLLEYKPDAGYVEAISNGIKGSDNEGVFIYSSKYMGKLYKKGYLGGYAMGVESFCPGIGETFLHSSVRQFKVGNGVWVEKGANGLPVLKWKVMNKYHSRGLKDGWNTASAVGCGKRAIHSIQAAEAVAWRLQ